MKRLVSFFLALMMLASCALCEGLQMELKGIYLTDEWAGETSLTHDFLAADVTVTNWNTETVALADGLSGQLRFMGKYIFDAALEFPMDEIEPLVRLDGTLLYRIPKMVAQEPEKAMLTINADGVTLTPALDMTALPPSRQGMFEGRGFNSPEEALTAYIEAFNRGDVNAMLSTFAIESCVDNMNNQATLNRLGAFMYTSMNSAPIPSDYMRDLLVNVRRGNIADMLNVQFFTYAWPEEYGEFEGKPVRFPSEDRAAEIRNFLSAFDRSEFNSWPGNIEIVGFMKPEELVNGDLFYSEVNQKNIGHTVAGYGCDEIAYPTLCFRVNGRDYLLFMECARYGDRWYNLNFGGNVSILANVSTFSAGLIPMDALGAEEE